MRLGFPVVREAYADRAYLSNGLLPQHPGVLHDAAVVAARAVRLAQSGQIEAIDGSRSHRGGVAGAFTAIRRKP